MIRRLVLLAALLSVACVQSPVVRRPLLDVEPPEAWSVSGAQDGTPAPVWWETYDDPQLHALIDLALSQNHDLQAAAFRVEQIIAAARVAKADLKPAIGVGLSVQRQQQVFVGLPIPERALANPLGPMPYSVPKLTVLARSRSIPTISDVASW